MGETGNKKPVRAMQWQGGEQGAEKAQRKQEAREGFSDKVTFEWSPKRKEKGIHAHILGGSSPSRGQHVQKPCGRREQARDLLEEVC